MPSNSTLILFFTFSTLLYTISSTNDDHQALIAFKVATNDPFNSLSSWNSSIPLCQWNGVLCSRKHQRVVGLNLARRNLTGFITPHIGNLSFLRFLFLDNNSFTGKLPYELGPLRRLQNFSISYNLLDGDIPASLSNCTNLLSIIVSYNRFSGQLPQELGSLSKLERIAFSRNNISGEIPSTFGNLSSLVSLYGGSNGLTGRIPDSLGRLTRLELIAFGENKLTGFIPPTIFNLSHIITFDLAANQIEGTLPPDLGNVLPNLAFFSIGINLFTGSIPGSITNASNLGYLHVGYNMFSGEVPSFVKLNKLGVVALSGNLLGQGEPNELNFVSSLINSTDLLSLGLDENGFGGELPLTLWNLSTTLSRLFLSENRLTGVVPSSIGKFINLQDFRLNDNRFTGMIPDSIVKLRNLQALDFSRNRFLSSIPSTIGNLSQLVYLYLSENILSNAIPTSLGDCQNLLVLNLSRNILTGPVAGEALSIPSLRSVDLSHNQLNSTLPTEIGNLRNLEYFNVSENNFAGRIPSTLGSGVTLQILDMEGNSFEGYLPSSLSSLRGLEILNLSRNKFDGPIPTFLSEFNLMALNLSFNDFNGTLPGEGIFKNSSLVSVLGNPKLCGGIPELKLPNCNFEKSKKSSLSSTLRIVISTTVAILGITMILGVLIFCCLKRRKTSPSLTPFDTLIPNVSYKTLLEATGGFSRDGLLGVGSYGAVYKGNLGQDRTLVAVKILNLSQHGALKSFLAECEALRNIRHRNLVKVLTACSSVDFQGNDFKALVYEFMPKGSLEHWLHPTSIEDPTHGDVRNLDMVQRLNIAIDIASAMDYLHLRCVTPIVHCDLKPSNVLLDDDLVAHVGDFGLARFLSGSTDSLPGHQGSSSLVRGTIGYTAPEYGTGSEPSTHGDVYSFGILLLEMFTGKRPTDEMFTDGFGLHSFVQNSLPDRVADIIEPTLLHDIEKNKFYMCLVKVLGVGVACSAESARERMNIADVASELQSIRDDLLRNGRNGEAETGNHE